MQSNSMLRKITTGYQITIPNDFRKENNLNIGSMVSVYNKGSKLVIEPFQPKSEALRKLKSLFKNTPQDFQHLSEQQLSKTIDKEIKSSRDKKQQ